MKIKGILAATGIFTSVLLGMCYSPPTSTNKIIPDHLATEKKILFDTIPINQSPMFPAVLVKENGKSNPLQLDELSINVEVIGNIATTTFELTYYNDLDRILEGQLYFPLGENKTVSRFAMDVNGEMREGVVVEKEKGRIAFESTTRRKIDPGLLEWTKGNNFKARVYPIPAKGNKKIIIAYEQELLNTKNGLTYIMPLGIKQNINTFNINIEVFKQFFQPKLTHNEFDNLKFDKWQESFKANSSFKNYIPNKQLGFSIPINKEVNTICEEIENVVYFIANTQPKRLQMDKEKPHRITIAWDVSNSSKSKNIQKELILLSNYLKYNNGSLFDVIIFSNSINNTKTFTIVNDVISYLKKVDYDGGTQVGSVNFKNLKSDEVLLFSDGISNFGKAQIQTGNSPIYTISSSNKSDFSSLKSLSLNSGGSFINLNTLKNKSALSLLKSKPYRLIGYEILEGNISELYPKNALIENSNLSISGQLYSNEAKLKLNFGFGSNIHHSEIIHIKNSEENMGGAIERLWAQKKLAHLDLKPKENSNAITYHGKRYNLVTRNTSLIVLDRLEDYVQHEIVPPASLQKRYFEIVNNQRKDIVDRELQHMQLVKREWNNRISWWNTDFKPVKKAEFKKLLDSTRSQQGIGRTYNWGVDGDNNLSTEPQVEEISSEDEAEVDDISTLNGSFSVSYGAAAPSRNFNATLKKEDTNKSRNSLERKNVIKIKEWTPDEAYLKAYSKENQKDWWTIYLQQKTENESSPSFYVDISALFYKSGKQENAIRILSNLAEMELENHQLLRILAYRLIDIKEFGLAIEVLKEVEKMKGEEPQTYRDLGLAYEQNGEYQKAIETLYKVVTKSWDGRFTNIEQIVLMEMNSIISRHKNTVNTEFIDAEFVKDVPIDVRVVLNWDTDNCDMDLWVTDPNKEKCFYSHKKTRIGGRISNDFTQGYGPEEFMLKNAVSGKYKIQANYYGTNSQKLLAPVTLKMQFFTGYGKDEQKLKEITLRLKKQKEVVKIAEIEF